VSNSRHQKSNAVFRRSPAALAVSLLLLLALLSPASEGAQLKLPGQPPAAAPAVVPPPTPATAPVAPEPIPLPQIADQAEALDLQLEDISRQLTAQAEAKSDSAITGQSAEINQRAARAEAFLQSGPEVVELREEIVYWRSLNRLAAEQRKLLTERADQLQEQITVLARQQAIWQATKDSIHDTAGIEVVAARVQRELDSIRDLRVRAQTQLNQTLTLQNELSETGRRISDTLGKLNETEERFSGNILDRDGAPLWSRNAFADSGQSFATLAHRSANQEIMTGREYFRAHAAGFLFLPILYVLAFLGAFQITRYFARPGNGKTVPAELHEVLAHPYAVGLLVTLLLSLPLAQTAPISITAGFDLCWIILLARLTPILIVVEMRTPMYLMLGLNLVAILRTILPIASGLRRMVLTVLTLAVLAAFVWLTRPSKLRQVALEKWPKFVVLIGSRIGSLLIGMAVIANILGYVSLARVLGIGTLLSVLFATTLYFVVRVTLLVIESTLGGRWATYLTPEIRRGLRLWSELILILIAFVLWWTRSEIYLFILQEGAKNAVTSVLDFTIALGSIRFTVSNVLVVLLILGIGFALAKGISSILRSVLVAKFPAQRGMPYAASKVTYYILSSVVVVMAVTAAGVDLNKFTVITGAVGVGIGFGLQDIVKNFASGLILLFERPIRVDDTVELSGLIGTVKRIGARSSTLVTGQGAEVIVPNSNLVSTQVINWTLSSPQRRIEIPVGVAYGADPAQVLALLTSVAEDHRGVLSAPAPAAFFMGFGDSALNFELRFWSANQDIWFKLKSDVTLAMAKALTEAGIEIPFPQRDLHLRSIDPSISQAMASRPLADSLDPANQQSASEPAAADPTRPETSAG
jgi:potassium-dependent mechanosensitive channel